MFQLSSLVDKFNNVINNESKFYKLFVNPIILCIVITIIIFIVESIYIYSKVKLKKKYDKISVGFRLLLLIFATTFIIMFIHSYVNTLSVKYTNINNNRNDILNASMSDTHNFAQINPNISGAFQPNYNQNTLNSFTEVGMQKNSLGLLNIDF